MRRLLTACVVMVTISASAMAATREVGANYTHWQIANCSLDGYGIVATYGQSGVRSTVRQQLAAMRANGLTTLRTIIWHMTDVGTHKWGVIPSKRGLVNPYKANLQNFAADVKAAGFKWEIAFGPQWSNNPINENYDPALLDENWRFIVAVRSAVLRYGPAGTKFDLLNEGAASIYQPTFNLLMAYDREIWSRYVQQYGAADATLSAIVDDGGGRLQNLVTTLNGLPLPTWFEAHTYGQAVDNDLAVADLVLGGVGLRQPMTLGETFYEDAEAAAQISTYVAGTTRPLPAVVEWPLMRDSACPAMSERPAYSANQYLTVR